LLHQLEAATASVEARKKMRPVARFNFIMSYFFGKMIDVCNLVAIGI
jgi:hypothetical protein